MQKWVLVPVNRVLVLVGRVQCVRFWILTAIRLVRCVGLKNPCHSIGMLMLIISDLNQSISRKECGDVIGVTEAIVWLAILPNRASIAEKSVLGGFVECVRLAIHQVLHVAEHANTNWVISLSIEHWSLSVDYRSLIVDHLIFFD